MPLRLHIGFDFWGAGNLGDDLMMDGFLGWLERRAPGTCVSAFCSHDLAAMRQRFPSVEWSLPGTEEAGQALVLADAWLGLGGSPFQTDLGPWLLDQMCAGMEEASRHGLPCFLVGVGLNNREAFSSGSARRAASLASRVWVRDANCLRTALKAGLSPSHVRQGADLAHLSCAGHKIAARPGRSALLLHEPSDPLSPEAVQRILETMPSDWTWLCQESRALANSETLLHEGLPPLLRASLPLFRLDYARASLADVRAHCQGWERMLSSRYHGSLAAAWSGSRVCIHERNHKLEGLRQELGLAACPNLSDPDAAGRALERAATADPELLDACRHRADTMLGELMDELS